MKSRSCWLIFTVFGLSLTSCGQQKSSQEIQAALPQAATKVAGVQINTFQWGIPPKTYVANQSDLASQPIAKANYTKLEQLLAAGKWKEADEETYNKMLEVGGKQQQSHMIRGELIGIKDIRNFPCPDWRAMDRLWVKYSDGRFGFSVQKQIYQSLGGTKEYDMEVWKAYETAIGWRKNDRKKENNGDYSQRTFNSNGSSGHLPDHHGWGGEGVAPGLVVLFFSHAETCAL